MNKAEELSRVLNGNRSAYYVGGTLCLDHEEDDGVTLCNINDENNTPEEAYLIACVYLQNKTPKCAHWDKALETRSKRMRG